MEIREEEKNNLNDSNFQNEGEYIITKKPKYKYEIKIVHDKPREQIKKSKTPDKVISLTKFNSFNKSQKGLNKQNYDITEGRNNHYDNYNNYNNYSFYDSRSQINEPKTVRNYSREAIPQVASQINIYSNTCQNFHKNPRKNQYNYNYNKNIEEKQCICHQEFNKMIQEYFGRGKKIKNKINNYDYSNDYINVNDYTNGRNNIFISDDDENNLNSDYYRNDYDYPRLRIKKSFKYPLKIQKSVNKIFQPKKRDLTPTNYNYGRSKYIDNNNNIFLEASNLTKNRKNVYTGNFSNENILQRPNMNEYLYIKNRKERKEYSNNNNMNNFKSNYSFISIDDSKNKSSSQYNSTFFSKKENNPIMIEYKNNNSLNHLKNSPSPSLRSGKNNELMIHKSSERKEQIRKLSKGQKIKPLIIKKKVKKPVIEKIKKEDGTTINVIKQTSIVTSIETKPIIDLQKKYFNNDNLVKECITNIYTTLTKQVDEDENDNRNGGRKLNKYKSTDNINSKNGEVFVKRKIMGKNMKQHNLSNLNDKNGVENEIKKEKIDYSKNKFNIDISAISNDLLANKNNNSSINYSSLYSNVYDQIEPSNNAFRINDEIKYIKYLYYRSSNLNPSNKEKSQSLSNYFLKLSDDEKISIITNLNDGNIENKKIYNKLINILKERRLKNENSKNNNNNTSGDICINDNENLKKIKRKPPNNILFKKKKVIK